MISIFVSGKILNLTNEGERLVPVCNISEILNRSFSWGGINTLLVERELLHF